MKYQVCEPLTESEYADLKASIAEYGVLVPVEVDEQGNILDGHHRVRAWQELCDEGLDLPKYARLVRGGMSEEAKFDHALRLNDMRRHMSKEARERTRQRAVEHRERARLQVLELRQQGKSIRQIVDETGLGIGTIHRTLSDSTVPDSESGTVEMPDFVIGKDGKRRDAQQQPKPEPPISLFVPGNEALDPKSAKATTRQFVQERVAARRLENEIKKQEVLAKYDQVDVFTGALNLNSIALASISDLALPQNSIDMVFTDPPYHDEYIGLYDQLGKVAAHALKPGGYCMAYVGKMFIPEIIACLAAHLEYVSIYAVFQPFSQSRIVKHNIFENWRPILVFKKAGQSATREWAQDVVRGTRDKSHHEWQQDSEAPLQYIKAYTKPGDVVLDPFSGGGTTAWACKQLGRYFVAFDVSEDAVKLSMERVADANSQAGVSQPGQITGSAISRVDERQLA